jgi:hypothetical protein
MTPSRKTWKAALPAVLAVLILAAQAVAEPAGIGWDNTLAARKGKAKTVEELSRMYDSRHCEDCHPKVYKAWELSAHSEPVLGKRRVGRKAMAILTMFDVAKGEWPFTKLDGPADVKVEHLMACAKCHLPQLADAEDSVARELAGDFVAWRDARKAGDERKARKIEGKLSELSVTCLICHNRNAIVHKWADGFPPARAVYGAASDRPHPVGKFPYIKQSPIQDDSLQCGQCHGLGPLLERDNPSQCPTVYGSYLFDYKARGGDESCQDCHMRRTGLGHNIASYREPAMIDAALEFLVDATPMLVVEPAKGGAAGREVPKVKVEIRMTNKAGHPIPDGCPTTTRLILDVSAKTPDGKEFYFKEKSYMPIPQNYGRGDKMGRGPFQKAAMIIDTALPPLRQVAENYEIEVPGDGLREIEVRARLIYLPYGSTKAVDDPIVWRDVVRKVTVEGRDAGG